MMEFIGKTLVVSAGRCGLLARILAQQDNEVVVIEALDDLDTRPRGIAYAPAAVRFMVLSPLPLFLFSCLCMYLLR